MYPTPCMIYSVCMYPQYVFHPVNPILCISLFTYSIPYVFHSVCAPLHSAYVPPSIRSPLYVCPTLCIFHSYVSNSMYPTPCTFHSLYLLILSYLPFLCLPPCIVKYLTSYSTLYVYPTLYSTPCASHSVCSHYVCP